jgi:hypothetical protein
LLSFGAECFVFQFAIQKLKIKIYRIIILSAAWYKCETWSVTVREERRLRVFESGVMGRVFGAKKGQRDRGVERII